MISPAAKYVVRYESAARHPASICHDQQQFRQENCASAATSANSCFHIRPVTRAIETSHAACKGEFRTINRLMTQQLRLRVFFVFIQACSARTIGVLPPSPPPAKLTHHSFSHQCAAKAGRLRFYH